jgi:hypothetical protein
MPNNNNNRKNNVPKKSRVNNRPRESAVNGPAQMVSRDGQRNSIQVFRPNTLAQTTMIHSLVNKGVITSTSAAEGLYAFSFALSDVADYLNYVAIWDIYAIKQVVITLVPLTLPSAPSTGPAYAFAYVAPDFDDATTPANAIAMLSYATVAHLGPSEKYTLKIQPSVDIATTTSAAASINGVFNKTSPWLDCSSPSVPHYGLKAAVTQSTSTNLTQWNVFCRYSIAFKRQQ